MDFLSPVPSVVIQPLSVLLDEVVTNERLDAARVQFDHVVEAIPILSALKMTPQTAPRHGEGPMVSDHILRMFAVIDAVVDGATMKDVEDVFGDAVLTFALVDAEEAIRNAPDVFKAYAVMHNVPKPDRVMLNSVVGSMGEKEGFVQNDRRVSRYVSASELVRYDKLRRADEVERQVGQNGKSLCLGNGLGVVVRYDDADRAIVAPQYENVRREIVRYFGLENAYEKFLVELCWSHDDVESFFVTPENEQAFLTFAERAGKAGINVERFLDALLGIALVDHALGRVSMIDGRPTADVGVFHRLVTAEHGAMPQRYFAREARQNHARKVKVKMILGECGLSPEVIFAKLGTPVGPERGTVMEQIYEVIREQSDGKVFGVFANEIEISAHKARTMLAVAGLTV